MLSLGGKPLRCVLSGWLDCTRGTRFPRMTAAISSSPPHGLDIPPDDTMGVVPPS
jgi:hypothetical protein